MRAHIRTWLAVAGLVILGQATMYSPALAQESADELAKKLSNPVASMISMPFQYNADFNLGPEDGTKHLLNIQPVIPTSISDDWNLITRVITPVVYQDDVFGNSGNQFGLGNITPSFFFSPKEPTASGWILGAGPVFFLPTATDDLIGVDKWGGGPTAVALRQTDGGWTYGALVNHIWSFAGSSHDPDVNNTFLQPFVAKAIGKGRTLTVNSESSYDWENEQWTIPLNFMYSRVAKVGNQMMSFAGGVRWYAEAPPDGPDWGIRLMVTFLKPTN